MREMVEVMAADLHVQGILASMFDWNGSLGEGHGNRLLFPGHIGIHVRLGGDGGFRSSTTTAALKTRGHLKNVLSNVLTQTLHAAVYPVACRRWGVWGGGQGHPPDFFIRVGIQSEK